ncbi:MAG: hypothetical protein RR420_00695 [Anaerovoracaceae bacterium]
MSKHDIGFVDSSTKLALSMLSTLNFSDIKVIKEIVARFDATILENISKNTILMDNIISTAAEAFSDIYLNELQEKIKNMNIFTMTVDEVAIYKSTIDRLYNNLASSVYQDENHLLSFLLSAKEKTELMDTTMLPIKFDAGESIKFSREETSISNTYRHSYNTILERVADEIRTLSNTEESVYMILFSTRIAMYIWFNKCNASKDKLHVYLRTDYGSIKVDILKAIERGDI